MVALEAWLRTTRAYDEHASLPERPDALALWVAGGKAGYCQMFAASLAALARLAGVPARVVEGFAPGDLRGGVYHVTDRDAHAWVEAWFPGYGWLPFDATPGRDLPARASSSSAVVRRRRGPGTPDSRRRHGRPRLRLPLARLRDALASGAVARAGDGQPRGPRGRRSRLRRWRRCSPPRSPSSACSSDSPSRATRRAGRGARAGIRRGSGLRARALAHAA